MRKPKITTDKLSNMHSFSFSFSIEFHKGEYFPFCIQFLFWEWLLNIWL